MKTRRRFLTELSTFGASLCLPFTPSLFNNKKPLKFGLIADPHADLIPDKNERLEAFIKQAIDKEVDFIIQLGDFCFPKKANLDFLNIWQQFSGPKYHVLGNHDMDVSTKEEAMEFWGMPTKYYSFDTDDFHFVVLDANYLNIEGQYKDYDNANFYVDDSLRTFINPAQIEWLQTDLQQSDKPSIVFSHQSLLNAHWGIKNRVEIQQVLEEENARAGFQKVFACFNGHDHIDFHREINQIHYVEINSMSYQWLGQKYSDKSRYSAKLYEQYQHLDKIAPYKDSLFAFVELNPNEGTMKLDGQTSEWLSPSPSDLGVREQVKGNQNSPVISSRNLKI